MTQGNSREALVASARAAIKKLGGVCEDEDLAEAKTLVETLRNLGAYEDMGALAEAVSRRDPKDVKNRRLYAQCLINTGKASVAIDVLTPIVARLPKDDPEFAEAMGLIGRANKQIFFDAHDKSEAAAQEALARSVAAYRAPYEEAPEKNVWHGVNLLAVLTRARHFSVRMAPDLNVKRIAESVVAALEATPEAARKADPWFLPTLAEASLGLGDWDAVERNLRAFAASADAKPFQIESTLRQFTEIWDVEAIDERGRGVVAALRARLLQLTGGEVMAAPGDVQKWRKQDGPADVQLEAILGEEGPQTFRWWKTGLERAASVASIRERLGNRVGTGFLLRAGTLGLSPPDEPLVLTNFHVVNAGGALGALKPEAVEIVFEAADASNALAVSAIVWSSPESLHDACLLRLQQPAAGVAPLPVAAALPAIEDNAKVYVIGHPRGQELAFSFQDNQLLDHEGPPGGKPSIAGLCRVHYRAPTEKGNSGSPVFNSKLWEVIALHHSGGSDMPRLNGNDGRYEANEGISIHSIISAIQAQGA